MGGFEVSPSGGAEPSLRYHPKHVASLTPVDGEQCQLDSLPGAGAS